MAPRDRVEYQPIVARPPWLLPGGARVALWVVLNVEHYEYVPLANQSREPWPIRVPHPDVLEYSIRDYGNRVGFWRLLDILDRYRIKVTVALNVAVLEHFPEIAAAIAERPWAVMSHGVYNSRYITDYTEDEERAYYRETIKTIDRHTGMECLGMFGPGSTGTVRTPDLMAEAGMIYHADWIHDDQPVPIKVRTGRMISIPYNYDLNDGLLFQRGSPHTGADFVDLCKRQFTCLSEEGGRVMCISLHPFRAGQPHMARYIEEILEYLSTHESIWQATSNEIAAHYFETQYDLVLRGSEESRLERPQTGRS